MSLFERRSAFKRIEAMVDGSDPAIEEVLAEERLSAALGQNLPHITAYLLKHFGEVIEIAIGEREAPTESEFVAALSIVGSPSNGIVTAFGERSELINSVVAFLGGERQCGCLFMFLTNVIVRTNGAVLFLLNDPVAFYKNVMKRVQDPSAVDFLISLFERKTEFAQKFIELVEADVLTFGLLCQETSVAKAGMTVLLRLTAVVTSDSNAMKRLGSLENMRMLMDCALDGATMAMSVLSFALVKAITAKMEDKSSQVFEFLRSEIRQVCNFVKIGNLFTSDKKEAADVVRQLVTVTDPPDDVYDLCGYLFQQMTQQKTNSFLHQTLRSFYVIVSMGPEDRFKQFLEQNRVIETVLSMETERDTAQDVSWWGHLTDIEHVILDKLGEDISENWNQFVNSVLKERMRVINEGFSIEAPERPAVDDLDADGLSYQCKFVDSCDMLKDIIMDIVSQFGEEEEEEEEAPEIFVDYSSSSEEEEDSVD